MACSRVACTAVGRIALNGAEQALVAHWNGTRWHRDTAVAIPPGSVSTDLSGVSCHTRDTCVAVGEFLQVTGALPLAEHES